MKTLKQLLLTGIAVLLCTLIYAQVPQKFNYQAVARNNNAIVANGPIGLQLTITQGNAGAELYKETQTPTTNAYGIFSLQVGAGTVVSGNFNTIDWKSGDKWLHVEIDPAGGTNYTDMGSSELESVPFALHADGTWDKNGNDISNPNAGIVVVKNGLVVDNLNSNTGTIANALTFGSLSGEGIASNRSGAGNNQNGLDFYTGASGKKMAITNNGKVGIGTDDPQALLHVKGSGDFGLANGSTNCVAFFENTDGANADGIAIKITNTITNRDNNFVTFYNGANGVTGRIEGFDASNGDWVTPPSVIVPTFTINSGVTAKPASQWFNPGRFPVFSYDQNRVNLGISIDPFSFTTSCLVAPWGGNATIHICNPLPPFNCVDPCAPDPTHPLNVNGSGINFNPSLFNPGWQQDSLGSLPSVFSDPVNIGTPSYSQSLPDSNQAQNLACWSLENGVADMLNLDPFSLAANHLKGSVILACKDGGVTYGSHGADYAEHIEKADHNEYVQAFDVVGIKGGKVSRNTEGAEQIMIVSSKPVVLGNTPKEGEEKNYVVCGFMGQLPCVVRGLCHKGDYVLASNLNDGTAIAIAPENIKVEMLNRIVGRAWGEQTSEIYGLVNVAIGLKTNEWVEIFKQQDNKMAAIQNQYNSLNTDVQQMKALLGLDKTAPGSTSSASIIK